MNEPSTNGVPSGGRDPISGRFEPGNRFSTGNSIAQRTRELRRAIFDAVQAGDVEQVIRKLMEQAKAGDTASAKLFLEFTCGRPSQSVEVTGRDGEPLGGPDLSMVISSVMAALAPFPDARVALAASLYRTRIHDGPDAGPGPGA
jgi:hypothetical protein